MLFTGKMQLKGAGTEDMTKKLIALFLAVILLLPTTAFAVEEKREWTDGEKYSLELPVGFKISGEEKLEFTLPFYSDYVTIKTSTPNKTINFTIDGVCHEILLSDSSTKYVFPDVLRMGEKDLYISGNASISEITFNEIMEEISYTPVVIETTDYEDATKTALIMKEGSPILKSRSAIRYYDYNNINVKPVYVENSLYVPADAFALALGIYWEEDLEKDFFVLRKEQTEVVYLDGEYKLGINNEYKPYEIDVENFWSKTYLPLRQVAELFGYHVLYQDGFIIVDYRSRARAIVEDYYTDLVSEFKEYMYKGIVGKTYYVSTEPHASDLNDGSEAHPWATLTKAGEMAQAGDTVIIGGGTYYDLLKPSNDGTAAHPITFKAKEGEEVILSATQLVTEFSDYKDGMVVAYVPWDMGLGKNQVFYKKQNLVEGRYPNREIGEDGLFQFSNGLRLDPVWMTEGDLKLDINDQRRVISDTLLQEEEEDYWKGAVFVTQHGSAWTLCLATVGSSKKGELKLDKTSSKWWFGADATNPNKGFLTCHINAVDQPGEWTMKDNVLYMMLPEGETAETLELEVKNRHLLVDLNDRKYVHIEGIKGFGGSIRMDESKMCVINNCDLKYISHYTYIDDQRNLYDDGNTLNPNGSPQRGEMGIFISGSDNAVVNTNINFSAAAGLFIVGSYAFVDNNVITDTCYAGSSFGGISIDAEEFEPISIKKGGHTITHNTVKRTARQSFVISRPSTATYGTTTFLPMEIAYNDLSETSICTLDTGTIYMWGAKVGDALSTTKLHHNYTYEINPKGVPIHSGIYNDNWMFATESFDNIQFSAMPGQFHFDVPYEQRKRQFPASYATVDSWNNMDLGTRVNGKDELTINDFPSTKPYQVGASFGGYKHDMTYEYYKNGADGIYSVHDMTLSEGMEIKDERVQFTSADQYIKIEDVDFDKYNKINIVYSADYYKTDDDYIKVYIGEDPENPDYLTEMRLYPEAKYIDDLHTVWKTFPGNITGKKDVWINSSVFGNASIHQVHFNKSAGVADAIDYDYTKIPGGAFNVGMKGDDPLVEGEPTAQTRNGLPIAIGAWGSNWLKYTGIKFAANVNTLSIAVGTSGQWSGGTINVRLGSPDGEILGSIVTEDKGWTENVYTVPMKTPLTQGMYDIYLTFEGSGSCVDLYWFGFSLNN